MPRYLLESNARKMKADKTLSIRIKSKTEQRIMDEPEIEMITQWNLKRIISVLSVFLIISIITLAYLFSRLSDDDISSSREENVFVARSPSPTKEKIPELKTSQNFSTNTFATKAVNKVEDTNLLVPEANPVATTNTDLATETTYEKQDPLKAAENEILNQYITQARLARWVENNVPHGKVDLPLRVGDSKAEGFFYFTDVKNLQNKIIFHEWLREGKSIYKRRFTIRSPKVRMATSKLFTFRTTGQWQVRLITGQGEVLHKIDFLVVNK